MFKTTCNLKFLSFCFSLRFLLALFGYKLSKNHIWFTDRKNCEVFFSIALLRNCGVNYNLYKFFLYFDNYVCRIFFESAFFSSV